MKKNAKTLQRHRQLILNYFRARKQFSNGVVEGLRKRIALSEKLPWTLPPVMDNIKEHLGPRQITRGGKRNRRTRPNA